MPVTSVLLVAPDRALRAESLQKTLQPHRSAPHTTTSHMLPSTCSACAQTQGTGTPHQAHTGRAHQDNRRLRCSPGELAGPPDSREQCLHTRGHTHVTQNQLCTHVLRGRESQLGKVSRGGSAPSPHNSLQPPHTHTRTHTVTCKCHSSLTSSPTVVLKGGRSVSTPRPVSRPWAGETEGRAVICRAAKGHGLAGSAFRPRGVRGVGFRAS